MTNKAALLHFSLNPLKTETGTIRVALYQEIGMIVITFIPAICFTS